MSSLERDRRAVQLPGGTVPLILGPCSWPQWIVNPPVGLMVAPVR